MKHFLIHSFLIHFLSPLVPELWVTWVSWSLTKHLLGRRQGDTIDELAGHCGATERQTTFTHIHTYGQIRVSNEARMHVFGL